MPDYYWNPTTQHYENARTGEAVAQTQIREWIDQTITVSKGRVRDISEKFVAGEIDLPAWHTQIQGEIKLAHTAMSEIAAGGRAQFTPAQAGRLGQRLKEQYKYLSEFSNAVDRGDVLLGDGLIARSELYAEAERGTYEGIRRAEHVEFGFQMERSILGGGDNSCEECIEQDGLNWQPIGEMVAIGDRTCGPNCNCESEFSMVNLFDEGE